MRLYHFTSGHRLPGIGKHGLTIGDVPTDLARNAGVVGVWLTTSETPDGHGLAGSSVDKTRFRLTVDLDDDAPLLHRWIDWAARHVNPATIAQLHLSAGAADPSAWYVFFGWIKPDRIVTVADMASGSDLADWPVERPDFPAVPAIRFRDKDRWHRQMLWRVVKAAVANASAGG